MTAALVVAGVAAVVWFVSVVKLGVLDEWHHFELGVFVLILAAVFGWAWLAWVAAVIMADDAVQHVVQLRRPDFRSPLHLLYRHTLHNRVIDRD